MKKTKTEVRPVVLVVHEGRETRELELTQDAIILGSGPTANVIIKDSSVSSIHAIIKVTLEAATLVDLGSETGTRLNGTDVREAPLKDGDEIHLGRVRIEVQLPLKTAPVEVAAAKVVPKKGEDRTVNLGTPDDEVTGTDTIAVSPQRVAQLMDDATVQSDMPPALARGTDARPSVQTQQVSQTAPRTETRVEGAGAPAPRHDAHRSPEAPRTSSPAPSPGALPSAGAERAAPAVEAPRKNAQAKRPVTPAARVSKAVAPPTAIARTGDVTRTLPEAPSGRVHSDLHDLNGRLHNVKLSAAGIPSALLTHPLEVTERATTTARTLRIGLFWGAELVDLRQIEDGTVVTLGEGKGNTISLATDGLPESTTLVTADGTLVIPDGLAIEARIGNERCDRDALKAKGRLKAAGNMTSTLRLSGDDRVAVKVGTVTLVLQYVLPAQTFTTAWTHRLDQRLASTVIFVALFMAFFALMVAVAPRTDTEAAEDLFKNSQRFARLMLKDAQKKPKQAFELSGKKVPRADDSKAARKDDRAKDTAASTKGASRVDPNQREKDRKVALNSGLLRALSGGKASAVSNLFGNNGLGNNINTALGGLKGTTTGDATATTALGSHGTSSTGTSVGIGGIGNGKSTGGLGNVDLGSRGRSERSVEGGKTTISGGLSQDAIKRVLDRSQSQLRYCYEKELQRTPDLNGKVTIKFTISGSGNVSDASVGLTTLQNANAEECMLRVFRRLRFPSPAGGGVVDVSYPMLYKPLGD